MLRMYTISALAVHTVHCNSTIYFDFHRSIFCQQKQSLLKALDFSQQETKNLFHIQQLTSFIAQTVSNGGGEERGDVNKWETEITAQYQYRSYVVYSLVSISISFILTIMRIIQIDDFLPAVVAYRIDNGFVVVGSHTNGEIQESWRRCEDLLERMKRKNKWKSFYLCAVRVRCIRLHYGTKRRSFGITMRCYFYSYHRNRKKRSWKMGPVSGRPNTH